MMMLLNDDVCVLIFFCEQNGLFGDANLDSFTVDAHETPDSINILLDTLLFNSLFRNSSSKGFVRRLVIMTPDSPYAYLLDTFLAACPHYFVMFCCVTLFLK
jgi:hypothetical protein